MIFKKGDKVYDHAYGWGEVHEIHSWRGFAICVNFDAAFSEWYGVKGNKEDNSKPTLSFTEYTLEGFSQVRPKEPLPFKKGDVCYFRGDGRPTPWITSILSAIDYGHDFPFEAYDGTVTDCYELIALENPLLSPDTKIYTKEDL
jgi:hypothetical protein